MKKMGRPLLARPSLRCSLSLLLVALVLLTGCTGVPTDSAPLVVRTVDRGGSGAPRSNAAPKPGASARDIVTEFLTAEAVTADAGHSQARQFLTNAATHKWQDGPVTVVDDTTVALQTITGSGATVEVFGRRVGQLDATGVFSPSLKGTGVGDRETFSFDLIQVDGQWRINQLQPGVLLSKLDFERNYQPRKLYFYDLSETVLVPDLRYCALSGQALGSWLLNALLAGPRPELAQSVINEVPDQVDRAAVVDSDPITVEMPGTSQLDANGRNRLAAQLAGTLSQIRLVSGVQLKLTDSGRPVAVPAGHGPTFTAADFSSAQPDSLTKAADPYFLRDGAVIQGTDNKPLNGPLGQPGRGLESVALRHTDTGAVQVAAVVGDRLEVGSPAKLTRVALPRGALSRPEWRPRAADVDADVWVGVGAKGAIFRAGTDGTVKQVSITSPVGGLQLGQVVALRFSPDGVRLAAVLRGTDGTLTAWIGSLVVSSSDVRIDSFEPLTPARLAVDDLAWVDATQLLLVAGAPSDETKVWQVRSDGSGLNPLANSGLPGRPTSIAAAPPQSVLVSASASIWTWTGGLTPDAGTATVPGEWAPFPSDSPTPGIAPVFAPW